jgi:hypothetical protein
MRHQLFACGGNRIPAEILELIRANSMSAFWHKADIPIALNDVCFLG